VGSTKAETCPLIAGSRALPISRSETLGDRNKGRHSFFCFCKLSLLFLTTSSLTMNTCAVVGRSARISSMLLAGVTELASSGDASRNWKHQPFAWASMGRIFVVLDQSPFCWTTWRAQGLSVVTCVLSFAALLSRRHGVRRLPRCIQGQAKAGERRAPIAEAHFGVDRLHP
jgi:hypothetical protein